MFRWCVVMTVGVTVPLVHMTHESRWCLNALPPTPKALSKMPNRVATANTAQT